MPSGVGKVLPISSKSFTALCRFSCKVHCGDLAGHEPSHRVSIMNDDLFGERYNYGMAESATSNPLRTATAMGRDVGNLLMGSLGFGGKAENDPRMVVKSCCTVQTANLKVVFSFQ